MYNEYHDCCRETKLISLAVPICQPAISLFSGHYLCISMVLLTVEAHACYVQHAGTCTEVCDCSERAHKNTKPERETGRKGGLSVQLAFCSAGSNAAPSTWWPSQTGASPLGSPRTPYQRYTWQGGCLKTLQRPYYTSYSLALQRPLHNKLPTPYSLLAGESSAT